MKNFKSIALGLTVGALAFGFSAFTNVQPKSAAFSSRWYQTSEGVYTPNFTPGTSCITASANPCILDFPNDVPTSSYPSISVSQLPTVSATYGTPVPTTASKRYNTL